MTIEEALQIISSTNFYSCFTNEKQDDAFDMAIGALMLFKIYKKEIKELERIKGDHLAHVIANCFRHEIEILEGSGNNGEQ